MSETKYMVSAAGHADKECADQDEVISYLRGLPDIYWISIEIWEAREAKEERDE